MTVVLLAGLLAAPAAPRLAAHHAFTAEFDGPNAMFRRGWNKNSISVGAEIVVDGYRAKNGKNIANGRNVTFADGRKMFVGSSGTGAPRDDADPTER